MKKGWKIALISLGSLLGVVVLVVAVAVWLILTPSKLTAVVNNLSSRFVTCDAHFEKVDLTLVKTFPDVGLEVHDVVLVNPMDGAQTDTVAHLKSLVLGLNLRSLLRDGDIVVHQVKLDGVDANLYTDSAGRSNYDVIALSSEEEEEESSSSLPELIDIEKASIADLNASYVDCKNGIEARVDDLSLTVKGRLSDTVSLKTQLHMDEVELRMKDSIGSETIYSLIDALSLQLTAEGTKTTADGKLSLMVDNADVALGGAHYVNQKLRAHRGALLDLTVPCSVSLDSMSVRLHDALLSLAEYDLKLNGRVAKCERADVQDSAWLVQMDFGTNKWNVASLLGCLPDSMQLLPRGMSVDADLKLSGNIRGYVADSTMPLVDARLEISDGRFSDRTLLPYDVSRVSGDIGALVDLSSAGAQPSSVEIRSLCANVGSNRLQLSGSVADLLREYVVDVRLQGGLRLADVQPFLPDSLPLTLSGASNLDVKAKASKSQISTMNIAAMRVSGTINIKDFAVDYDSIQAQSPQLSIRLATPTSRIPNAKIGKEFAKANVQAEQLHALIPSSNIDATLEQVALAATVNDVLDSTLPLALQCEFSLGQADASMSDMKAGLSSPTGSVVMVAKSDGQVHYELNYNSSALEVQLNDSMSVRMAGLAIGGSADYDSTKANVLQQWSPSLDVDFKLGYITMSQLPYTLQIPNIKFNYKPERCEIASANLVFGNSDYYLSGAVTGLEKWISHDDMLKGDLYFTSNYTNVDDLLDVFSGLGSDADTLAEQQKEVKDKEASPFIVPKDVDFTLHTRIKEARAYGNDLQELAGDVTVRDGVAVLDQVGFTCKAARMQLTAIYRTPRMNHLFAGLDFHLLDISIKELIDMVPMVDTLVPMLKSFEGNANFHLAAETYLDASYKPKMSTLRGAASIDGKNLVVLDSETFDKIAKLMLFKKSTTNVIDSLDVQATVFRRDVKVMPFMLSMDKYQVVVGGRHTLDKNFDYHLEIIKSPLPARLAVDVYGFKPLKISLGKCQYADLYRPEKRNDVEEQAMAIKQMIRQSLEANVKESTRTYEGLGDEK